MSYGILLSVSMEQYNVALICWYRPIFTRGNLVNAGAIIHGRDLRVWSKITLVSLTERVQDQELPLKKKPIGPYLSST